MEQPSQRLALLCTVIVLGLSGFRWWPPSDRYFSASTYSAAETRPVYHEQFLSFKETPTVHAPTIVQRQDGRLVAAWYAGSREGASDVRITKTIINPVDYSQSPPSDILSVVQTRHDNGLYIRKLGNPVIHRLSDGRLMMVYVGVSFGGWAASRLYICFSDDGGLRWSASRPLVTSPFLNISTLVKGKPFNFDNGDIGLPVYHEFLGKFSELLILDSKGNIKDKRRLSWGRYAIQPVIEPLNRLKALALLRDSGEQFKRIGLTVSDDGGRHWEDIAYTSLPNPNSAVALAGYPDILVAVFNNHTDDRHDLSLAISQDQGNTWKVVYELERKRPGQAGKVIKFSYPYLINDSQGNFHLVYTWRKKRIKYVHFNMAWLNQQ